jgi:acetoacetate decarboxylase
LFSQNKEGKKFDWSNAEAHLTGVVYDVGREELNALLPEGYEVDPECEQPTVLFEVMNLRNLPWLAGRGYNTWGVYAGNVKCTRVSPPVIASYQLVLFESFTDPIVTGREELGFCKMYADLPDPKIENGNFVHTASWFGTEFMRLEVPNLTFRPVEESPSFKPRPYTVRE